MKIKALALADQLRIEKTQKMANCKHEKQNYTKAQVNGICSAWNECRECGTKLHPDIWKAEL